MEKTNSTVLIGSGAEKEKKNFLSFLNHSIRFLSLAIVMLATQNLSAQCTMVCKDANISLGLTCDTEITYSMVLDSTACPGGSFIVEVYDGDDLLPTSPVVPGSYVGETLTAKVIDMVSGNSCWSNILIEDKMPPMVMCSDTLELPCTSFANLPDPPATDNCDPNPSVIVLSQTEVPLNCDSLYVKRVERKYTAVDASGNQGDTCTQILLLERVDFGLIEWPDSLIRLTMNQISCDEDYDADGDGVVDPSFAGVPTLDGEDLYPLPATFCNIGVIFEDFEFPTIQCVRKIVRTWTVREWWCSQEIDTTYIQLIEIVDDEAPILTCPDDITVGAGIHDCEAEVYLPPVGIDHNCPSGATVNINYPGGFLENSNGGTITLSEGVHTVQYQVQDDCGNIDTCSITVTVEDLSPPVPVCEASTVVSLTTDGVGKIYAETFDDGSFDNCGDVYFKVRRMTVGECDGINGDDSPANGNQEWFDDYVKFCCEDVGDSPIMVILRVYDRDPGEGPVTPRRETVGDLSGHWNECMVEVIVQDKLPPSIVCPPNITISCTYDFDPTNLDAFFGKVVLDQADRDSILIDDADYPHEPTFRGLDGYVVDNCGVTVTSVPRINIDQCGNGRIIRTFRATDPNGSSTCRQIITINNPSPFDGTSIIWPRDYEANSGTCDPGGLDPETLPIIFGYPRFTEDECDLVSAAYDDWVFPFGTGGSNACFKIIRRWKVIDWCGAYTDPQTGQTIHPTWEHEQVLKVINDVAPEFVTGCDPVTEVSVDPDCDDAQVVLVATATDDCTNDLVYSYRIDAFNTGTFDINGSGNNATGDYPVGTHRILWTVEDQCGNSTSCESTFTVVNSKLPTPYCYNGLAVTIMPSSGMIAIWASDFDAGSYHSCGLDVTVAFSPNPLDTGRIFTCDDLGVQTIEMYVIDENGEYDFCTTFIDIQDNNGVCGPNPLRATVSGRVITEETENVAHVDVDMEGSGMTTVATNEDGVFAFPEMNIGGNYVVNPNKDSNYMNGISTYDLVLIQKHLLGVQPLSSPYRMIAADVNRSNHISSLDIVELRKLILGIYTELPNNDSWRFVDAAYTFEDQNNPFAEVFPESHAITNLTSNMTVDFYGVKIGDVNGTVTPTARGSEKVDFIVDNQNFVSGEKVTVDFTAADLEGLLGYQFTMKFDQENLTFDQVTPGVLDVNNANFGTQFANRGMLTASWSNANGVDVDENEVLFSLSFNATGAGTLSNSLSLNSQVLNTEAYGDEGVMNLDLSFRSENGNVSEDFALFQNSPNPFNNETKISFNLPEASAASLSIYDATGRLLKTIEGEYTKGFHEMVISQNEIAAKGVLYYRLDTEKYSATRKMIIMK